MIIGIELKIDVPSIPRKYTWLAIDKYGLITLHKSEPTLYGPDWKANYDRGEKLFSLSDSAKVDFVPMKWEL